MDRGTQMHVASGNAARDPSPPTPLPQGDRRENTLIDFSSGGCSKPILYFDGVCGLCNRFVDFVIKRDRGGVFHFAPLQGETARERLPESDFRDVQTMVLSDEQGVFRKSTAAVRILMRIGGIWRVIGGALSLVPRPLRDAGYSFIARHRYAIFGKKETCRIPTAAERARFLP